eukprot:12223773-Alexandrium_andersonii.AAC.1
MPKNVFCRVRRICIQPCSALSDGFRRFRALSSDGRKHLKAPNSAYKRGVVVGRLDQHNAALGVRPWVLSNTRRAPA